ncbi:molybdopterin-dependent oxidoreductase [Nocardioidaceae bacterium SCSIO 66511]|nr:molybdopterin-dependent oxidoreductase [Nocardioidaceae bacterium SCSIO 66511]
MSQYTTSRRTVLRLGATGVAAVAAGATGSVAPYAGATPRRPAAGPIVKPLPERWFYDYGTNAEMRWGSVHPGYLTPLSRLFVRDHTSTPRIAAADYSLRIYGDGLANPLTADHAVTLSYEQLRAMRSRTTVSVLECTDNGRSYFDTQQGTPVSGTPWKLGGVGVVQWRGVPLADVLKKIGLSPAALDVMATGLDARYVSDGVDYGNVRRPFPISKALDDALLAYEANGRPLPPDHGFPVRLVLPGWVGIANIKWLGSLEVSSRALESPWNTKWYRMTGGAYPDDSPALTTLPVKSAFELPLDARLRRGRTRLTGRSWSGTADIARVEVSTDGGASWDGVRFERRHPNARWVRWSYDWRPRRSGRYELMARATDTAGRTQPMEVPYNDGGYLFWAVVRHPVTVV